MKPFFVRSDIFKYIGAIRKLLFAFIGVEILYMIPMDKKKNRSILKYNLITVGLIGIIYILIFESNISITGIRGIINQKSTLFQVLRGIDIQYLDILKRFDGFFFIFWSMDILCSTSIWLYGTAFFTKKIFPKISFIKITIFIVLVSFILSILPRKISQVKSVLSVVSKVSPLFLIVMPIIIYIGVKVKNNEKISD